MRGRRLAPAAAFLLVLACGCLEAPPGASVPHSPDARVEGSDGGADASSLEEGLVAYFPMDDLVIGGSGATAPDWTGGGDGTCTDPGCPEVAEGHLGDGYLYDGIADAVLVPDRPGLHSESGTVAVWVKASQAAGVIGKPYGEGVKNSWLLFVLDDGQIGFEVTSGIGYTDPGVFQFDAWTHLAMTWSGTSSALFIDGVYSKPGSAGTDFDDNPVVLGADRDGGVIIAPMEGLLDDVRIYNRQLELAEVETLAEM